MGNLCPASSTGDGMSPEKVPDMTARTGAPSMSPEKECPLPPSPRPREANPPVVQDEESQNSTQVPVGDDAASGATLFKQYAKNAQAEGRAVHVWHNDEGPFEAVRASKAMRAVQEASVSRTIQTDLQLPHHVARGDQREQLRAVFTSLDVNGEGCVALAEMTTVTGKLPWANSDKVSLSLAEFVAVWESQVGSVGWEEVNTRLGAIVQQKHTATSFVPGTAAGCERALERHWAATAAKVFEAIDADQNGALAAQEIRDWVLTHSKQAPAFFPTFFVVSPDAPGETVRRLDWDLEIDTILFANDADSHDKYKVGDFTARYVAQMKHSLSKAGASPLSGPAVAWDKAVEAKVEAQQAALGLEVNAVEPQDRLDLRAIFTILDKDGSGTVRLEELCSYDLLDIESQETYLEELDKLGGEKQPIGLERFMLFWESITGSIGSLDTIKQVRALVQRQHGRSINEMQEPLTVMADRAFRAIDKDTDQMLTAEELLAWAQTQEEKARAFLPPLEVLEDNWKFGDWFIAQEDDTDVPDMKLNKEEFTKAYVTGMQRSLENMTRDSL